MFYRNILSELKNWAIQNDRKPLIIRGARQVGKTTLVNIFSKEFSQYIYLNLENKEDCEIFNRNLTFDDIIKYIFLTKKKKYTKKKTLLFIDEIQNSPYAIKLLRYFYEKEKDLFVISAGSLLEAMLDKEQISFPVGRVQYIYMYPLTFEEYLKAIEAEQALDYYHTIPLPDFAFQTLLKYFNEYVLIGGMPEIVKNYIKEKDIIALNPIYESLLISYINDVSKYAKNLTMIEIIKHTIESVPYEAGKRIKFQGFGNSNYKSREIGEALRILERAMLIYLLYPSTSTIIPIIPNMKKSPRLQFLDTGLINYFSSLQNFYFNNNNLQSFYKGFIAEHVIGQELIALNKNRLKKLSFWIREKKQSHAEVDFIIQYKDSIIPIEVKSGKEGTLRSLHQFINRSKYSIAIRLYANKFKITGNITSEGKKYKLFNIPYFLTGKIYDYLEYFVK